MALPFLVGLAAWEVAFAAFEWGIDEYQYRGLHPLIKRTLKAIDGIDEDVAQLALLHVLVLQDLGIPAYVSEGERGFLKQLYYRATGSSRTLDSAHRKGRAWDIGVQGYTPDSLDSRHPGVWELIGQVGEELGARWGGRWSSIIDKPHFEV